MGLVCEVHTQNAAYKREKRITSFHPIDLCSAFIFSAMIEEREVVFEVNAFPTKLLALKSLHMTRLHNSWTI
jgi:hypothetical protein